MLTSLAKLLKVLNSEAEPRQISLAFSLSMVAGFLPFFSLPTGLVFLIAFLLRVNLSAFFLGTVFLSAVAYLLDPLFHRVGLALLAAGGLEDPLPVERRSTIPAFPALPCLSSSCTAKKSFSECSSASLTSKVMSR